MLTEAKNPFEVLDNIDIEQDNKDYMSMLEPYLENVEVQDPKVGYSFPVEDIISTKSKLYAKVNGNYLIQLNASNEKRWFIDVFLRDLDITNKKEMITYLSNNPDYIEDRLNDLKLKVEIVSNKSGVVVGSIAKSYSRDLKERFSDNMSTDVYECKITDMNKGGYLGYIDGVQVFIPGSLASHKKIEFYSKLVGKTIKVMIDGYVQERDIFIASNKKYIKKIRPQLLEEMDKTKELTGTITGVAPFGIFVAFENYFSGLLHVSEMSPETNKKFKNGDYSDGDEISFYIKSYTDNKIILSENSYEETVAKWEELEEKYLGKVITSKPFKKVSTGYLFEIEPKIIGLLYDIEASKYNKKIELGEEYQIKVDRMDFDSGKIFLNHFE